MRVIPVVALLDEITYEKLRPLVDDVARRLEHSMNDIMKTTMTMSGWSFEMLAWGTVLHGFATMDDLEIIIGDGEVTTTHVMLRDVQD